MKKKIFSGLLFLIGISFLAYPYIAHYINDYAMQQEIEEFEIVSAQPLPFEEKQHIWDEMERYNEALLNNSDNAVQDAFTDEVMASNDFYDNDKGDTNPSTEGQNAERVASGDSDYSSMSNNSPFLSSSLPSRSFYSIIRIPKIDIELPVYLGASDTNLMKGAAHITGTSLPVGGLGTHAVIAGHRGTLRHHMFLHINTLKAGDTFDIQTLDKTMTYRVTKSQVVLPDEVSSLGIQENKDLVTLVTCLKYPMNYKRLLVHGERIN
ncbi:MAG: class C sortase [Alkalibacterium sp.]|nr:class C sortase [Alkalibacterium sp.]MDN6729876.1 class C sortase [Alkalibacterium sp.]